MSANADLVTHVWRIQGGKLVEGKAYLDPERGRQAA
jgi:hypothetical protein